MDIVMGRRCRLISISLLFLFILLSAISQVIVLFGNNQFTLLFSNYNLLPILWGTLILTIIFRLPKVYPLVKFSEHYKVYSDAMIIAIILMACSFLVGILIFNIGYSPYDLKPYGIFSNMVNILLPLIAREYVRCYILNTYGKGKYNQVFLLITLILVLCNLNLNGIKTIQDYESATKYLIGNVILPICESVLLCYLALYGGVIASIVYISLTFTFRYMIPYLPDLNWFGEGVIGIIIPLFSSAYLLQKYNKKRKTIYQKKDNLKELISTSITYSFAVILIWFVVGVFPIVPSVIATGSMEPMIKPGDVVLIEKIQSKKELDNLKKGDVIQFKRGKILITHRIYDIIKEDDGKTKFVTKGDNNSVEDDQRVKPEDIKGTLVKVIPKVGYPTLIFKQDDGVNKNEVEF